MLLNLSYFAVLAVAACTAQKKKFQLRISSVNVIKSAEEILNGKRNFFVQCCTFN